MDQHRLGSGRKVIPQIFHELELLRRAQVKDGWNGWVHPEYPSQFSQSVNESFNRRMACLAQHPPPEVPLGCSLGMDLHVEPGVAEVLDLRRRQIERAAERAAGRLRDGQVEGRRPANAFGPSVNPRD